MRGLQQFVGAIFVFGIVLVLISIPIQAVCSMFSKREQKSEEEDQEGDP